MRTLAIALLVAPVAAMVTAACAPREDTWNGSVEVDIACREVPSDCYGTVGGGCDITDDCDDGVCCHDKNCGTGMCTYLCHDSSECPPEMACEHGFCFFRCSNDAQCGPGQKCEHGDTICEYEGGA